MFNDAWLFQALHMTLAAFVATGFAVAGVHALMMLKKKNLIFHRHAFLIAMVFGSVAAILQPISGDLSAKDVAKRQPAKLAAMEALFKSETSAPLLIGGIPDERNQRVNYAIELPGMLSFLVHGNLHDEVKGLDTIPKEDHPPVLVTHLAFQIMVGIGVLLMLLSLLFFLAFRWKNLLDKRWFLLFFALATPLGFVAVEAGWTVTEVGRQPWIIWGIMRTEEAVTPMPGIRYSFYVFTAVYALLSIIVLFLLKRQIQAVPRLYASAEEKIES